MPDAYMNIDADLSEVPVNVLPLTDDTDFKTIEESIAYDESGMDLNWNFIEMDGTFTQTNVTPTTGGDYDWAHAGNGMYTIEIPASGGASINNDTEGTGWFTGVCDGVLPWRGPEIHFRDSINNISDAEGLTYLGTLATDLDKVRFYIGDVAADSGPQPSGGNFTDNEINGLITAEGNWQRAVAACFETLEAMWSQHTTFSADGVSVSQSDTTKRYQELAAKWRRTAGGGANITTGFAAATRIDGYSYDVSNEDVDEDDAVQAYEWLQD